MKMSIRQRCRHDGAQIYHLHYIQPLVERTRDTVLTRCALSAPYSAYFLLAASSSRAASAPLSRPDLLSVVVVVVSFCAAAVPRRLLLSSRHVHFD